MQFSNLLNTVCPVRKSQSDVAALAAGALATGLLAFAGTASAVTYSIDNGNIIEISNLELIFDSSSPQQSGLYNVFFFNDTGVNQYGPADSPTFDFLLSEDGVTAMSQITDALNVAPEAVTGASAAGSDTFFIPLIKIPIIQLGTAWGAAGAENIGGVWGDCENDCILGVRPLNPNALETFARVEIIPIPAAVWLFGSGLLGLIGVARRKRAA